MPADRIILLRHGRTQWNVERRFQGTVDSELDALGLAQAEHTAEYLAGVLTGAEVTMISSPQKRAAHTAQALATRLGVTVHPEPRLRETEGGAWEGLNVEQIRERFGPEYQRWLDGEDVPTGGAERRSEAGMRAYQAVQEHAAALNGGVLVAVAHGGSLKGALLNLIGLSGPAASTGIAVLGNTGWTELEAFRGTWRMVAHNRQAPGLPLS